jgi:hypothetical protein
MLIDTDVIVWCLRGNPKAAATIAALEMRFISQVTRMELIVGCRTKSEITPSKTLSERGKFSNHSSQPGNRYPRRSLARTKKSQSRSRPCRLLDRSHRI